MNIILTGPRQVGKTTVINKVLASLSNRQNFKICGLKTFCKPNSNDGKDIFLSSISNSQTEFFIGSRKNKQNIICNSRIFDTKGILFISENANLVVIDEIGNLEEHSVKYLKTIEKILKDDSKNVIIVVQQDVSDQITKYLNYSNIVFEVSQNNRDAVVEEILKLLA